MGRFGIEFSDKNNAPFKINQKRHYGSVINSRDNLTPDSRFQRGLAWASYYVLVFVALCVFNKPAMADIIQHTTPFLSVAMENDANLTEPDQWALRSTLTTTKLISSDGF
jgi:hypothetical protein